MALEVLSNVARDNLPDGTALRGVEVANFDRTDVAASVPACLSGLVPVPLDIIRGRSFK